MRGVFTAAFLAGIEECLDDRIANHLDLIVGTSTGGLIALGLAAGRSGREMLDLYRDHGVSCLCQSIQEPALMNSSAWSLVSYACVS